MNIIRASRGEGHARDPASNHEISTSGYVDTGYRPGAESAAGTRPDESARSIGAATERATAARPATGHRTPEEFQRRCRGHRQSEGGEGPQLLFVGKGKCALTAVGAKGLALVHASL